MSNSNKPARLNVRLPTKEKRKFKGIQLGRVTETTLYISIVKIAVCTVPDSPLFQHIYFNTDVIVSFQNILITILVFLYFCS